MARRAYIGLRSDGRLHFMTSCFIGIDSGTQSTRAVVMCGKTGRVLGAAAKAHDLIGGLPPGCKEQHPHVWIDAIIHSVRKALRHAGVPSSDVAGIGVSGQQHGFVPLDKLGRVIRPAKLWCDTSTTAQSEMLLRKLGGLRACVRKTGNAMPPGFTGPKILWLKQREPSNYRKLATVLLPHDYINFWLTGRRVMEPGDASGTGLLDVRRRAWQKEAIRAVGGELASRLPPIQPSDQPCGALCAQAARALGLSTRVLVSAGGGDNMMGAIGTGNVRPGRVTASLGTSGTIYAYSDKPVVDPHGEIAAFCDSTGGWLPLLCTMNVTVATEMVRNALSWTHAEWEKQVEKVPAGCDGLMLLPYLEGERTPSKPEGTGVFFGVNPRTYRPDWMARAAMEGVTLGMNYGLRRLRSLGIRPKQIRVTGGGSNSRVWRQVLADVFGCPVVGMKTSEGAAHGAALQAMWCLENSRPGRGVSIGELTEHFVAVDPRTEAFPRSSTMKTYARLQELQDRLASDLGSAFRMRAAISN